MRAVNERPSEMGSESTSAGQAESAGPVARPGTGNGSIKTWEMLNAPVTGVLTVVVAFGAMVALLLGQLNRVEDRLTERIDGVTGRIDRLTGRTDGVTGRIDGLTGRIDGLTGRIDRLTGRIDALREHMREDTRNSIQASEQRLLAQIGDMRESINDLEESMLAREQQILARIGELEKSIP